MALILDPHVPGTGLGRLIGGGLAGLLQPLVQRQQQQQTMQRLQQGLGGVPGVTPEMAKALSHFDPQTLNVVLANLGRQQLMQQKLAGEQQAGENQQRKLLEGYQAGAGTPTPQVDEATTQFQPSKKSSQPEKNREERILDKLKVPQEFDVESALSTPGLPKEVTTKLLQYGPRAQKNYLANQEFLRKRVQPYIDTIRLAEDTAKKLKPVVNRMLNLETTGDLDKPWVADVLGKTGFEWMLKPDSVEYRSLEKQFLGDLKKIFGGRIAVEEMRQFMRGVPTLDKTPEGRKAILNNFKNLYRLANLEGRGLDKIFKKTGDKFAPNIRQIHQELIKPEKKKLLNEFETGLRQSNKMISNAKKASSTSSYLRGHQYIINNEPHIYTGSEMLTEKEFLKRYPQARS